MDTNIIAATEAERTYTDIAGVLREVADALAGIHTKGLAPLIVGVTLQPAHDDEAVEVATVDAIAAALGVEAKPVQMASGPWHQHTERKWPAGLSTRVAAFCGITAPEERAAREEAERLRAERDEFRNAALMYAATVDELRRQLSAESDAAWEAEHPNGDPVVAR